MPTDQTAASTELPSPAQGEFSGNNTPENVEPVKHNVPFELGYVAVHATQEGESKQALEVHKQQQRNAKRAKSAHEGWKLHLNIDPTHAAHRTLLHREMKEIQELDSSVTYKTGEGGGSEHDAPGKEVTVYVGSLEDAKRVANRLEGNLHGILLAAEGETLQHDIPLSVDAKVWGRFDVYRTQPINVDEPHRFMQWGTAGLPRMRYHAGVPNIAPTTVFIESYNLLKQLYGAYFDDGTLLQLLTNMQRVLQQQKVGSACVRNKY